MNTKRFNQSLASSSFTTHRLSFIVHRLAPAAAAIALGAAVGAAAGLGPLYALAGLLALGAAYAMLTNVQAGLATVVAIITLLPFGTLPFKAVITPSLLELALAALLAVWVLRLLARSESYDLRMTTL